MRLEHLILEAVLIYHDLEIDIDVLPTSQIDCLFLLFLLLQILHLFPPFLSLQLQFLNLVQCVGLFDGLWGFVFRFHLKYI